ncbi:MAG: twitching motility protein PilT, partial [Cryptosporangiaceae bacterium]|nr:twitching motility protein PilT [Cryptosporangiaceae bacterium]
MPAHPIGSRIDALLDALWNAGGTDLLLTAGMPPQLRVHGALTPATGHEPLTTDDTEALLAEVLSPGQSAARGNAREYDFSFSWREHARIRGNAFTQRGATAIALRMIPQRIPTMAALGLPPILHTFTRQHQGLVLVTGPTGSGKSTSLAAMIQQINHERACHIITIEDPVEYVHQHARSAVSQREVGSDTGSFGDALRSALREDPDVVLVG